MTEYTETQLEFDSSTRVRDFEEKIMGSQKISVSDHITEKSGSFVVDMEGISFASTKDASRSPRIAKLQKINSAIGSQVVGGNENKANANTATHEDEPEAAVSKGTGMRGKAIEAMITTEVCGDFQAHQQIPIEPDNIKNNKAGSRLKSTRKFGSRRHFLSFFWSPNRILFLFATLSSVGTILLIYFTLATISEPTADANALDWKQ